MRDAQEKEVKEPDTPSPKAEPLSPTGIQAMQGTADASAQPGIDDQLRTVRHIESPEKEAPKETEPETVIETKPGGPEPPKDWTPGGPEQQG